MVSPGSLELVVSKVTYARSGSLAALHPTGVRVRQNRSGLIGQRGGTGRLEQPVVEAIERPVAR